jgi:hypothetical protein
MNKNVRLTVVAALIAFHLAGDVIWTQCMPIPNNWPIAAGLGFSIAQVNLIATWAALAPGRLMVRLPWALFMGVLMWYALVLGQSDWLTGGVRLISREDAVVLGLSILFGILVIQVPLWVARCGFGWRLVAGEDEPSNLNERQFHLSHLLAGMLLLSVALGLGRVVLPAGKLENLHVHRELWILLPIVAICNLLVTSPCIWGAFARWKIMPLLAGIWVLYAWLVTLLQVGVLTDLMRSAEPGIRSIMCVLNLSQCVTVWGALLLLRATGFRLVRRSKSPTSLSPTPAAD